MPTLTTFACRMSGVLASSPTNHLLASVERIGEIELPVSTRTTIRQLVKGTGTDLDTEEFYDKLSSLLPDPVDVSLLVQTLRHQPTLNRETLAVLTELAATCRSILLVDYPAGWLDEDLQSATGFDQLIDLAQFTSSGSKTEMLRQLLQTINCPVQNALYIDRDAGWTTAAVRMGLNAILYTNRFRLAQELALRGLLGEQYLG